MPSPCAEWHTDPSSGLSRTTSFVPRRSFPTVPSLGIPANLAIIGWRQLSELSVVAGALLWRSTAGKLTSCGVPTSVRAAPSMLKRRD
jgi:hypothetical protein